MARKIRIGIVGTGMMAHSHALSFGRISGVEIAACCDIQENVAREFAQKHNIPLVYTQLDDLLKRAHLDAVAIVTPDQFHPDIAIQAARAGIHVLCEKPLAVSAELARTMAWVADEAGIVAMVNLSYRKSAALYAAKRLVSSGKLGHIRHVKAHYLQSWLVSNAWGDWKTGPQWLWRLSTHHKSLGVLGDVGVHLLDFATFPVGLLQDVQCTLATYNKVEGNVMGPYTLDANDSATIVGTFENGAMGVFQTTRWASGHLNSIELSIHGSEGALSIDLDESYTDMKVCLGNAVHKARWSTRSFAPSPSVYERFIQSIRKVRTKRSVGDPTGGHDRLDATGSPALTNGSPTGHSGSHGSPALAGAIPMLPPGLPTFHRGVEVQAMLDACFESATTGQKETIHYQG